MHKVLSLSLAAAALVVASSVASAETFAAIGTVTAVKSGDNVTITATGIPATTLVHFQKQGIRNVTMTNGVGVLERVSENGARFQLKDANGKWLLIVLAGNTFKMVGGVAQECKKSKDGCALEVKKS